VLFQLAALLLLSAIGVDLVDTSCDRRLALDDAAAFSASRSEPADLCDQAGCIPDCFCCCTSSIALAAVIISPAPTTSPIGASRKAASPADGTLPLPYRPPLSFA